MQGGLPYGLQSMLKDGHKHISGLEEAVIKNIEACKELAQIARTSLGPNGACRDLLRARARGPCMSQRPVIAH
eukprot:325880-Chlamydomonas_euryale.AAC.10